MGLISKLKSGFLPPNQAPIMNMLSCLYLGKIRTNKFRSERKKERKKKKKKKKKKLPNVGRKLQEGHHDQPEVV